MSSPVAARSLRTNALCRMTGAIRTDGVSCKRSRRENVGLITTDDEDFLDGQLHDTKGCWKLASAPTPARSARVQDGDFLVLHVHLVRVQASGSAFAAILGDGSVVTWGAASYGGNSSSVQDQLKNVQQIQASGSAFAAILGDGSVVTWGAAPCGGDSSSVQDQLKNVRQIQASFHAFAAILGDGSVVTWGNALDGGDSGSVQDHLKNVQQIQASSGAFAAILGDGSVVTWGAALYGGDSVSVQDQLKNVQQIQASNRAFAAILGDGSVVTWGNARFGGDSSSVQDQLKNVRQIQAAGSAFAAILGDGSVVTWGAPLYGGDSGSVQDQLKNVQQIQASNHAFAAILGDGSVVTWGAALFGGNSSSVQDHLKNVQQIQASGTAFAAILGDGSVVTWGAAPYGGDSGSVQDQLKNVQQIQASSGAFAAILGDGSVVTWGDTGSGGDCSAVQDGLKPVQEGSMSCRFAVTKQDPRKHLQTRVGEVLTRVVFPFPTFLKSYNARQGDKGDSPKGGKGGVPGVQRRWNKGKQRKGRMEREVGFRGQDRGGAEEATLWGALMDQRGAIAQEEVGSNATTATEGHWEAPCGGLFGLGSLHAELVSKVKRLQRQSEETRFLWWRWCEVHGDGWRDPKRYQVPFLQSFFQAVETNSVPQVPMSPSPDQGVQEHQIWWHQELTNAVKDQQRESHAFKLLWWAHCDTQGNGIRDPGRHSPEFLEDFLARCPESNFFIRQTDRIQVNV
eukprot:s55_g23.t1